MEINKRYAYLFGVFIALYILIYIIYSAYFGGFKSPMYILIPIPAFFMAYYIPEFFDLDFEGQNRYFITVLFFFGAIMAFFLAAGIYYANIAYLQQRSISVDLFSALQHSAYLLVVLFGTLALVWKTLESRIIA